MGVGCDKDAAGKTKKRENPADASKLDPASFSLFFYPFHCGETSEGLFHVKHCGKIGTTESECFT